MMIISILNDDNLIQFFGWLIVFMLGTICSLLVYIWTQREKQLKADRIEAQAFRIEIHDKFTAIDQYISDDKVFNGKMEEKTKSLGNGMGTLFKKNLEQEKAMNEMKIDLSKLKTT